MFTEIDKLLTRLNELLPTGKFQHAITKNPELLLHVAVSDEGGWADFQLGDEFTDGFELAEYIFTVLVEEGYVTAP
jgi:hypothetical protein